MLKTVCFGDCINPRKDPIAITLCAIPIPVSLRLVLQGSAQEPRAGKPSVRKTLLRVLLAEINLSLRRSL